MGDVEAEVDVTLLAYAQWISSLKEQVAGAKYSQKIELEAVREMARESSSQLAEFKRYCTTAVQRLESQVSDVRARLTDIVADGVLQARHQSASEQRQHVDRRGEPRGMALLQDSQAIGQVEQLRDEVASLKNALATSHEHTISKFGEVDRALNVFRASLAESKQDAKRGQDLLGQAINTLSQDLAEFQKQVTSSYGSAPGHGVDDQRERGRREVLTSGTTSAPVRNYRPDDFEPERRKGASVGLDSSLRSGKLPPWDEEGVDVTKGRRVALGTTGSDGSGSNRRGYG